MTVKYDHNSVRLKAKLDYHSTKKKCSLTLD